MADEPLRPGSYDATGRYIPGPADFAPNGSPRSVRSARSGNRAIGYYGYGVGDLIGPTATPQQQQANQDSGAAALRGVFADRSGNPGDNGAEGGGMAGLGVGDDAVGPTANTSTTTTNNIGDLANLGVLGGLMGFGKEAVDLALNRDIVGYGQNEDNPIGGYTGTPTSTESTPTAAFGGVTNGEVAGDPAAGMGGRGDTGVGTAAAGGVSNGEVAGDPAAGMGTSSGAEVGSTGPASGAGTAGTGTAGTGNAGSDTAGSPAGDGSGPGPGGGGDAGTGDGGDGGWARGGVIRGGRPGAPPPDDTMIPAQQNEFVVAKPSIARLGAGSLNGGNALLTQLNQALLSGNTQLAQRILGIMQRNVSMQAAPGQPSGMPPQQPMPMRGAAPMQAPARPPIGLPQGGARPPAPPAGPQGYARGGVIRGTAAKPIPKRPFFADRPGPLSGIKAKRRVSR
jgi:hypothetical protein